jgi:hypothetical protein
MSPWPQIGPTCQRLVPRRDRRAERRRRLLFRTKRVCNSGALVARVVAAGIRRDADRSGRHTILSLTGVAADVGGGGCCFRVSNWTDCTPSPPHPASVDLCLSFLPIDQPWAGSTNTRPSARCGDRKAAEHLKAAGLCSIPQIGDRSRCSASPLLQSNLRPGVRCGTQTEDD